MACCRSGPNGGCCGEKWCIPPDKEDDMIGYCCPTMERFVNQESGCVPTLLNGLIVGCDDRFDEDSGGEPIQFCPWCGEDYNRYD